MTATRTADTGRTGTAATRRRGPALEDAIREAAWVELSEVGYGAFSVEAVAARARTGKASIYRRWTTKQALVLDALCTRMPSAQQCGFEASWPESMSTADALRLLARDIALVMRSPVGDAIRAVKCEAAVDPVLAQQIDVQFQAPRRAALMALLRRGVERGEVRPDAVIELVADVVPAMLTYRVILQREPIGEPDLTAMIEQVFLPMIEAR